jgi:hypothetical protein
MATCLTFGFFKLGADYDVGYYRTVGVHPPPVSSSLSPLQIYPHYDSCLSSARYALTSVSIRGPSPLHYGTLPENAFAFVVGSLFVRTDGGPSLIDASQMTVVPAEAGPPLSTDDSLFPQFAASYIVGFGCIAADRYTLLDHSVVIAVTMSQHVRDSVKTFEVACVLQSFSPSTRIANSFVDVSYAL